MLPINQLSNRIRAEGRRDGYAGMSALHCPYKTPHLRDSWLAGHTLGARERRDDMASGVHPDIYGHSPQPTFKVK